MSSNEVWQATVELADVWRGSSLVDAFRKLLPRNNDQPDGIPEALRNLDAGARVVSEEPLLTHKWGVLAQQLPFVDQSAPALARFLERVATIGGKAECGVAWIRSRIPGYPQIPVPHLAHGTHLTCSEVRPGLGWRREALLAGLQYESAPRDAGVFRESFRDYVSAMTGLVKALEATVEWCRYSELLDDLSPEGARSLRDVRRELAPMLEHSAIGEHAQDGMLNRFAYRRDRVSDVVASLPEDARNLSNAFEELDELIELVSLRVLGQLVAYGGPRLLQTVDEVERAGRFVSFQSDHLISTSSLIAIDHPLVPDVAVVTEMGWYFRETGESVVSCKAKLLPNSKLLTNWVPD